MKTNLEDDLVNTTLQQCFDRIQARGQADGLQDEKKKAGSSTARCGATSNEKETCTIHYRIPPRLYDKLTEDQ